MRANVSAEVKASRILKKGEITDLTAGFKLPVGSAATDVIKPFSIIIIPKNCISIDGLITAPTPEMGIGLVLSCKMFYDNSFSDYPILFNQETVAFIVELGIEAIDLDTYRVYWGCGSNVVEEEQD